jgi:hypothetical protein
MPSERSSRQGTRKAKSIPPQANMMTPHLKRKSPIKERRKGKKRGKSSYNAISFNYDNMPSSIIYTSIPIGKAPYFDGSNYNQWNHCMKNYLYSISPKVWQVICDGVEFPEEDEQPTLNQLQKIHHNAQAITILTSSVDKEEFN